MSTKSLTLLIPLPLSNRQSTSLTQGALGLLLFLRSFKIHCMLYLCLYLCFSSFFLDQWLSLSISLGACFFSNFEFVIFCLYSNISNWWVWPYISTMGFSHGIWPWDRESWRGPSQEGPNWPGSLFHQQQHPWWWRIHHSQSLSFLNVHCHKPPSRWYTCSLPPSLVSTFLGLTHSISLLQSVMVWGFGLFDG